MEEIDRLTAKAYSLCTQSRREEDRYGSSPGRKKRGDHRRQQRLGLGDGRGYSPHRAPTSRSWRAIRARSPRPRARSRRAPRPARSRRSAATCRRRRRSAGPTIRSCPISARSTSWSTMPAQPTRRPFDTMTDEMWQGDLDLKLFAADPLLPPRAAADEASANGAASSVCSTSAPRRRAPTARRPGQPRRQMALTKALSQGERAAQCAGQLAACRRHRQRPDRAPPQTASGAKTTEEFIAGRPGGASRSAAWARPRSSPAWPASCAPTPAPIVTGCAINVDGGRSPVV